MIVRIGFAPRRAGLSTSEFLEHWRTEHADAAARLPGLRRYVQLHPVLADGVHALGYPGFDACSALAFDDLGAMDAAFASPEYLGAVVADEDRLVDKDRFGMFLGRGGLPDVAAGPPGCWLVTWLRRHPAVPADTLATVLHEAAEVGAGVVDRCVLASLDVDRPGRQARIFDAVEVLGFPDAGTARAWVGSPAAERAARPLAGLAAGTTRLLAEPVAVI